MLRTKQSCKTVVSFLSHQEALRAQLQQLLQMPVRKVPVVFCSSLILKGHYGDLDFTQRPPTMINKFSWAAMLARRVPILQQERL